MSPPSPDERGPPKMEENDEVDVAIETDHLGRLTPLGGSQVPPLRANNSVSDDIGKKCTFQNNQRPVSVPLPDLLTLHLSLVSATLFSQEHPVLFLSYAFAIQTYLSCGLFIYCSTRSPANLSDAAGIIVVVLGKSANRLSSPGDTVNT